MTAILIFAGRSTRFWPLSEKSFFPVAGTCLLAEQVKRLKEAGIKNIILVAGAHNKKEAKAMFPTMTIVEQKDLDLGMRGALLSALPKCTEEKVLIVSANDFIDVQAYKDLMTASKQITSGGVLLARKVKTYFPGGYLSLKGKRITSIVEKPTPGTEPSSMINLVAHVHASKTTLLKALKTVKPTKDDGYEVALDSLFQTETYTAMPYTGLWQAVKYPWHLLDLLSSLLPSVETPSIHPSAVIHRTAVIEGSVVIEAGVKVFAHATITGPAYIGKNTIVANNALVRGSSIGEHCVVGYSTEICRSILSSNVWTHMNYVGDSVIGNNVSLGGGTTTGNLRLDEAEIQSMVKNEPVKTGRVKFGTIIGPNCRFGFQSSTLPGVKIGSGSFINATTLVSRDIPDQSFVKSKQATELDIRPNHTIPSLPQERDVFRKKLA